MKLEDSRRLTGPNLLMHSPGAICDVEIAPARQAALIVAWQTHLRALLRGVGWERSECFSRRHENGVNLAFSAPIDCLYAATEINEEAFERALCELNGEPLSDLNEAVGRLKVLIAEEANPALLELADAAAEQNAPFLVDDDDVTLGYGQQARTWSSKKPPVFMNVDWEALGECGDVPVALVTGTNGKSTTVRLAAAICAAAGRVAGVTSTDYIRVGDEVIDQGDYSGPGGARQLLRHPNTELALLEVARGGILRRGLGVTRADAALITNVAADHLGEYGIHTVDELRAAKFVVQKGLAPGKPLIVNADDAGVVAQALALSGHPLVWFSEDVNNPAVCVHVMGGGEAFVVQGDDLCYVSRAGTTSIVAVTDIPVTLQGNARHNVQNALAAAALCHVLGCSHDAIRDGLLAFDSGPDENPGRGNFFEGNGIKAVVDFAHNEHGLRAMAQTIASMPAKRRLVLLGQAGDRSDALIEGFTLAALEAKPDQLVICQLPGYERGRQPDEVPRLIERIAIGAGMSPDAVHHASTPSDGTQFALDWAKKGDLLLVLALTQRDECIDLIRSALA